LRKRADAANIDLDTLAADISLEYPQNLLRQSAYLQHPVFNKHHSEHEMLRYLKSLENKDLSLVAFHDSAGQLHHEAQCHQRNDSRYLARDSVAASFCPYRPDEGIRSSYLLILTTGSVRSPVLRLCRCNPTPVPRVNMPV
jgi:hypothetical protein